MAVAVVDAGAEAHNTASANPITSSITVGSGANLLVVFTSGWFNATQNPCNTVTYNGLSLTKVGTATADFYSNYRKTEMWVLENPPTGAAYNLIATWNAARFDLGFTWQSFSGYGSLGAFYANTSPTNSTTSNPTLTISDWAAGDYAVGNVLSGSALTAGDTAMGNYTSLANDNNYVSTEYQTADGNLNWTCVADEWAACGAAIKPVLAPVITKHPSSIFAQEGGAASFEVQATGADSYQWQRNDGAGYNNITGATNSVVLASGLTVSADSGDLYRCAVTNANGTAYSNAATLSVFKTDVYLRSVPSDTNPNDVRLYNPNSADATGNQTLTQSSRFDNTNAFYTHVLTPGVVALTQSSRFDNTNSFYAHTLSQGGTAQSLTQSARFDNSNSFYTHALSATIALAQSSRFDNSQSFYTHTLSASIALTQATRFDNANTFYTHSLAATIALSQSARFDNTNSFYAHALTASINLVQSARFDNSNSFYTHALTPGVVALTQSARFDNANSFYAHTLSQVGGAQTLTQASRFDNSNSFYAHTLTPGAVALAQSIQFNNANSFYAHTLTQGAILLTQSARFDNANSFYTHALTTGAATLVQSSRFDDANSFYMHTLTQDGVVYNSENYILRARRLGRR